VAGTDGDVVAAVAGAGDVPCVELGDGAGGSGVVEGTGAGRSVRRGVGRGRSALATVVGGAADGRGEAGALGAMAVSPIATADEADEASVRSRASAESTVAVFVSRPQAPISIAPANSAVPDMTRRIGRPCHRVAESNGS